MAGENFCVGPTIMQPSVVRAFYEGDIDEDKDMVNVHGCEIPFNAREINAMV